MTVRTSRFARPIAPGAGQARTIGWWAAFLGAIALAHFVGALIVAYLYLRGGQLEWPPPEITLPGLVPPVVATMLTVLAALATTAHLRWTARDRPTATLVGVLAASAFGSAAIAARVAGLLDLDFRWDDHAFGSLYWLLASTHVALVAAAVFGSLSTLAQHVMGLHDAEQYDEIHVLHLYWWFVAVASVAMYVTADVVTYL